MIAAGLAAGPASASVTTPQLSVSTVARVSDTAHLAWLHVRHLEHLAHLEHVRLDTFTTAAPVTEVVADGIYSPSQLGELWLAAGGSPAAEGTAECIAHFESGGNANAISPTADVGLWQIHVSWGPEMATTNPSMNARAAVEISSDGTNWSPWTTAPDCGVLR